MEGLLNKEINGNKYELLIDTKIFEKDIVLKAAYNFLDKGYFFFKLDEKKNIILQFTPKDGIKEKPETIIGAFSDELLSVYLRNKLEIDNKEIREKIYTSGIGNSLDITNFVELDTDQNNNEQDQIDFDKDIDEILKEIENDPELKIDEEEIEKILKEIEEESEDDAEEEELDTPKVNLDVDGVKKAKENFEK